MSYSQRVGNESFRFGSINEVMAKASPLRSGDLLSGAAAKTAAERVAAQRVLANIELRTLLENPALPYEVDAVTRLIADTHDTNAFASLAGLTVGEFREWLLHVAASPNAAEQLSTIAPGLTPEMVAAVSKLMSNGELIAVSAAAQVITKFRNTLGLPGRLATRLQPNHPADNPLGVAASIIDGLRMGAGDAVIGINPATDSPQRVRMLLELLDEVRTRYDIPTQSCVLTHVSTTLQLMESGAPVDLVFQSIAGTEGTNKSFGVELSLLDDAYAAGLELGRGTLGNNLMYFETGQGSALSAGDYRDPSGQAIDQQTLEARAYGLARHYNPFIVNTVVGFIGPEYLYDGKQIIRAGLEDQFCGKLLGLQMGVDVCYTNHAEADSNDMDTLLQLLIAANTGFVITVPGSDDVMLGYQSLSYHDVALARQVSGKTPAPEFAEWLQSNSITDADGKLQDIISSSKQQTALSAGPSWQDIHAFSTTATTEIVPAANSSISMSEAQAQDRLRRYTPARMALGHQGGGLPTSARTQLLEDHGMARDSVHSRTDWDKVATELHRLGYGEGFTEIHSQVKDRMEYLTRPDLGRLPRSVAELRERKGAQVGIVLADGLSPQAVHTHGPALVDALYRLNAGRYEIDEPVFAHQSRVALGDHIAAAASWDVVIMIIGERPGMSVPSSLGLYITYKAKPGTTDEQRNCISNVHPPEGTDYEEAAEGSQFFSPR